MRLRPVFLLFVLLTLVQAAQAAGQRPLAVSGTVTNALSGAPVPNAIVIVEALTGNRQARTGADGKFSFSDVPPGTYHLRVMHDVRCATAA